MIQGIKKFSALYRGIKKLILRENMKLTIEEEKNMIFFIRKVGSNMVLGKSPEKSFIESAKDSDILRVKSLCIDLIHGKKTLLEVIDELKVDMEQHKSIQQVLETMKLSKLDHLITGERLMDASNELISFLNLKKERENIFKVKRIEARILNTIFSFTLGGLIKLYYLFNSFKTSTQVSLSDNYLVFPFSLLIFFNSVMTAKIVKDSIFYCLIYVAVFLVSHNFFWSFFR